MQLRALTSLRFFAALTVVFSHFEFLARSKSPLLRSLFDNIFYEGYVGVTFFFILSGFILSHSYKAKLLSGAVDYLEFLCARIARIFPLHWLTLLLALPFAAVAGMLSPTEWHKFLAILGFNLTLLQSYVPYQSTYFSLNAPSWSLSVEMFFYLLFPFLITVHTRFLIAVIACVLIFHGIVLTWDDKDAVHFLLYVFPPPRIADFVTGILLYRIYEAHGNRSDFSATAWQLFSVSLLTTFFLLKDHVSPAARYDIYYLAPMGLLILSFAWQGGYLARMVSGKAWVFLGEASYSLYLIHQLVIRYGESARLKVLRWTGVESEVAFCALYLGASIVASALLFLLFEREAKALTLRTLCRVRSALRARVAAEDGSGSGGMKSSRNLEVGRD